MTTRRKKVKCVSSTPNRSAASAAATAADEGGVEAMTGKYRELREKYYGSHSYDFTDMGLSDFARSRAMS